MTQVSFDEWLRWSESYTRLPYVKKYKLGETHRVLSWERVWDNSSNHAFVLESGKGGRYTFLGLEASSIIRGNLTGAVVTEQSGLDASWQGAPLELVKRWMSPFVSPRLEGLPKFIGGCVGYWGYDVIRTIERLPELAKADLSCPDYAFLRIDQLWIIDHVEQCLYCAVHTSVNKDTEQQLRDKYRLAEQEANRMKALWDEWNGLERTDRQIIERIARLEKDMAEGHIQIDIESIAGMYTEFSKERYMQAVQRIQDYIRQGDVFQVNLSVRQSTRLDCKPARVYEWLRYLNPSPYMGYLQFPDFQLVSGSPELLVQLDGNKVRTRPIAGTRPRGANADEDLRLRTELLANEKERAEHIMLVDLERNDLGRISRFGTVKVEELMTVELYSHVMHIVSEVTGELAEQKDAFDVMAAVFPGGTITGAPKIRTMEIIEELEPTRRGPYTGSIGWIDYNGDMEFNIVIRTLLVSDGIGHVQAGAGIVIDSDPEREYTESLNKAKALWKAMQYASLSANDDKMATP